MENNFIQMAASAGYAVAYTIGLIFKHIIDCGQLFFTKSFTNIFDGTPQIIVQRCAIAARRWPNDNSFAADNTYIISY